MSGPSQLAMSKGFIVWPSEPNSAQLPQQLAESTRIASDFHPGSLFPFSALLALHGNWFCDTCVQPEQFHSERFQLRTATARTKLVPWTAAEPRAPRGHPAALETLSPAPRVPRGMEWGAGHNFLQTLPPRGRVPGMALSPRCLVRSGLRATPLPSFPKILPGYSCSGGGCSLGPDSGGASQGPCLPRRAAPRSAPHLRATFRALHPGPGRPAPTVAQRFAAKHPDPPRGRRRGGPGGDPADFQETGNREKFAKRSKALAEQQAGARPPCTPSPSRAPAPAVPSSGSPNGNERSSPQHPPVPTSGSRRPRAPLPRHLLRDAEPRPPAVRPPRPPVVPSPAPPTVPGPLPPAAPSSSSPAGYKLGSQASRDTESRFPRGTRVPDHPTAPRSSARGAPRSPAGTGTPAAPGPALNKLPAGLRGGRSGARGGGAHLASGRAAGAPGGRGPGAAPSRSAPAAHSRIDPRGLGRAGAGIALPRREPQTHRAPAPSTVTPSAGASRGCSAPAGRAGPGGRAGGGRDGAGRDAAARPGTALHGTGRDGTLLPAQPGGPPLGTPFPPRRGRECGCGVRAAPRGAPVQPLCSYRTPQCSIHMQLPDTPMQSPMQLSDTPVQPPMQLSDTSVQHPHGATGHPQCTPPCGPHNPAMQPPIPTAAPAQPSCAATAEPQCSPSHLHATPQATRTWSRRSP